MKNLVQLIYISVRYPRGIKRRGSYGFYHTGLDEGEIGRRELINRIAEGDAHSFEIIYNEYARKIYGYLKIRLEDHFLIKDIMQDVFVGVWKGSRTYNGSCSVDTWIFSIARNRVMDALRQKYRRKEVELGDEAYDTVGSMDFTEQVAARCALGKALKSLPEGADELLYLVYGAGLSYRDAAELLNIPVGTVKSRLYNIKLLLKRAIYEERE